MHQRSPELRREGFSLIDLMLAIGITALLFGGIFMVFFSIVDTSVNYELRRAAASILAQQVELTRNLPYAQVGVVGGIPSGVLEQYKPVSWDGTQFTLAASVRNIDDPFDGTVTSTPADSAPADYKLVEFTVSCVTCAHFTPVTIVTTVAPPGLETASLNGSLFIGVFDANGSPVANANVHVVNASTSPLIDFTDVTNSAGQLQLVDVPTSTQRYAITVTKAGYSSEQTYPLGAAGNPNPTKTHATVASQTVTQLSFAIDRLAPVSIISSDVRCQVYPSEPFSLAGSKLIGTSPDVLKYSVTGDTGVSGNSTLQLEWDSYSFNYTGTKAFVGTSPVAPLSVAPSSTIDFHVTLAANQTPSLRVTTRDSASGQLVNADVVVSGPSYSASVNTGSAEYTESNWSGGRYVSATNISAGADVELAGSPGTYSTSSVGILESNTIDLGGVSASLHGLSWLPQSQPGGTGTDPVKYQIAVSDIDGSWNYLGPDGTSSSYFTAPATTLPGALQNKRYLRYKVFLKTDSSSVTPSVSSVSFEFSGPCVPQGQRLFQSLPTGSYTVSGSAPGYTSGSTTISVGSGTQSVILELTQQ